MIVREKDLSAVHREGLRLLKVSPPPLDKNGAFQPDILMLRAVLSVGRRRLWEERRAA